MVALRIENTMCRSCPDGLYYCYALTFLLLYHLYQTPL